MKRLYKSRKQKILCGVCGGMAECLDVDPTIIRLVWVFLTLAAGTGIPLYIICAIIFPDEDELQK